ncbi:MAG: PorV/PorQ family protein [Candidatus Neomarinimicrobiota bacterium]
MKKLIVIAILSTLLSGQSKVGTTASNFLGIGVGPRSLGMGGASTSIAGDAAVMIINPGALSRLTGNQAMFAKTNWLVDTNINFAAAVLNISRSGSIGFYLTQVDYGREEITDLYNQDGTDLYWTASDMVSALAYSRNLTDQFSIGGAAKYIVNQIHNEKASAVALDVGLLYRSSEGGYRIGMSISNFGPDMTMEGKDLFRKIDLDETSEGHNETIVAKLKTDAWPLPLFFRVGLSTDIISRQNLRLSLALDTFIPSDDVESAQLGFEAAFYERLFLRGGYRSLGNTDSEEGLTLGGGVKVYSGGLSLCVDYALQEFGLFDPVSHLGVSVIF